MPKTICPCGQAVDKGTKCACRHRRSSAYEQQRGSAAARGYDAQWREARAAYLAVHPVCVECGKPSECVDHIVAHKGYRKLFWERSNWRALCIKCNSRKAALHEGGFGR